MPIDTVGIDLIGAAAAPVASVTGEGAYDTVAFYEAASARDRTIAMWKALGRHHWKQVSGYHRQARVENAAFRYKSIMACAPVVEVLIVTTASAASGPPR